MYISTRVFSASDWPNWWAQEKRGNCPGPRPFRLRTYASEIIRSLLHIVLNVVNRLAILRVLLACRSPDREAQHICCMRLTQHLMHITVLDLGGALRPPGTTFTMIVTLSFRQEFNDWSAGQPLSLHTRGCVQRASVLECLSSCITSGACRYVDLATPAMPAE